MVPKRVQKRLKVNPKVYTTQEGLEEIKSNPQVYTTQEGEGEIKSNPQVYTTCLFGLKVEACTVNPLWLLSFTSSRMSSSSLVFLTDIFAILHEYLIRGISWLNWKITLT